MEQLSWPQRFGVEIRPSGGAESVSFTVVTWLHRDKAVALAVDAFHSADPDQRGYDVRVEELGPARHRDDGTVEIGDDLHDRYEF